MQEGLGQTLRALEERERELRAALEDNHHHLLELRAELHRQRVHRVMTHHGGKENAQRLREFLASIWHSLNFATSYESSSWFQETFPDLVAYLRHHQDVYEGVALYIMRGKTCPITLDDTIMCFFTTLYSYMADHDANTVDFEARLKVLLNFLEGGRFFIA